MSRPRTVSTRCVRMVRAHEGLRLSAYLCPAGVWTIGYGHTGPDVRAGLTITEPQAETFLRLDLDAAGRAVNRLVLVDLEVPRSNRGGGTIFPVNPIR
ncbi:MAG: glycoside hydrolase family protein [Alphaproteobacteria bacterium]|nr:glycoside hydrolase family protein [Alphaproteobacteria bacterium]